MNHSTQARKKKRRLKKPVRRGCAVMVSIIALVLLSLVWDALKPAIGWGYGSDEEETSEATYIAPEDTATVDSALMETIAHFVHHAPRINRSLLGLYVYDITAREPVWGHRDTIAMPPASTTKLLTAAVALHTLGPGHVYDSKLLMNGTVARGKLYGTLIVSMDDDPFFASFQEFAKALSRRGVHHIEGSIVFDLTRTDTLRAHSSASAWDIRYKDLPFLMRGAPYVKNQFMAALQAQGISYHHNVFLTHPWLAGLSEKESPARYRLAVNLARTQSKVVACETHPFAEILEPMLLYSDNVLAEAVFHHAAHATDRWGSRGITSSSLTWRFINNILCPADIDRQGLQVFDGSGLATANRFSARFLVALLTYIHDTPHLHQDIIGQFLPSPQPGRRGTLSSRMKDPKAQGRIFAKTGTLATKGVSTLAGYCYARNGHCYAFAILQNQSDIYEARLFQDKFCALLSQ